MRLNLLSLHGAITSFVATNIIDKKTENKIENQTQNNENEIKNIIVVDPICAGKNCKNVGKLRCPNCKKFGIKDNSYFCGKECFNSSWATHKLLHEDCKLYFEI